MSRYEALLFVHLVGVVVWVGSAIFVQILGARAMRAGDPRRLHELTGDAAWASNRVFMPASLVVLVFGILLVIDGPWRFGQLWVSLGLGGYVLSSLVGMAVLGPRHRRLEALAAERGPEADEVRAANRSLVTIMRLDLLVLMAVIADMVAKPGL
jgi:uncharacterized membrane protein